MTVVLRRSPDKGHTKIELLVDETVGRQCPVRASSLLLFDLTMRIGDVAVRCGGIGGVHTEAAHREKGYSRRVLEDSTAFMRESGYHLGALFGIPDYYHKFGYTPAFVSSESSVDTRDAEAVSAQHRATVARYRVRDFCPEDAPAVSGLYNALTAQRTGTIVRDPGRWQSLRPRGGWSPRMGTFVLLDGDRVVGYAAYRLDPWRYAIVELGYADHAVFGGLLAESARRAVEARVEHVVFHMPPDDPFIRYCRRYGCQTKVSYPRCGGGMARIINQRELLELLQPLFAQRLQKAGQGAWSGTLVIATDLARIACASALAARRCT
jgi:predicted acetyltransferase